MRNVADNGGAYDAGIKVGDIIKKINNKNIEDYADLSEAIGSRRPGDKVEVTYLRNGKTYTASVKLKDQKGGTSTRTKADLSVTEKIGAEFDPLSERVKIGYGLDSGVIAKNVNENGEMSKIGLQEGYIVLKVNGKPVNSQADVERILNKFVGNVRVEFVDDYGRIYTKGFKMPN